MLNVYTRDSTYLIGSCSMDVLLPFRATRQTQVPLTVLLPYFPATALFTNTC